MQSLDLKPQNRFGVDPFGRHGWPLGCFAVMALALSAIIFWPLLALVHPAFEAGLFGIVCSLSGGYLAWRMWRHGTVERRRRVWILSAYVSLMFLVSFWMALCFGVAWSLVANVDDVSGGVIICCAGAVVGLALGWLKARAYVRFVLGE